MILFVQYSADRSGSTISGLHVVRDLVAEGLQVHCVFAGPGELVREYERLGCTWEVVHHGHWLRGGSLMQRARRLAKELLLVPKFLRIIRAQAVRGVYINTLMSASAAIAARLSGTSLVWHDREIVGDPGGEIALPFGGWFVLRSLLRRASLLVCNGQAVVANAGLPANWPRTRILHVPIGDEFFRKSPSGAGLSAPSGVADGTIKIGVPATLRPVRGVDLFLKAFARLGRPDCHAYVTGADDNQHARELRSLADSLGCSDRVHWLGRVEDMISFYDACDVICVPSRAESFGRTVVEALARRRPVVAHRVGGIPETIESGVTGELVDPGDADEMAHALQQLIEDSDRGRRLAGAGFERVRERHSSDSHRKMLAAIVREAGWLPDRSPDIVDAVGRQR